MDQVDVIRGHADRRHAFRRWGNRTEWITSAQVRTTTTMVLPMTGTSPTEEHERVRILIADDHRMVIEGIRAILDQEPSFEIVGDASNGREAVEKARALSPDVIIMDISMPDMDGIEATRAILEQRSSHPPAILVLSMYGNKEFVEEIVAAGARGYVLKNTGREELRTAIRRVHEGGNFFARPLLDIMDQADAVHKGTAQARPVTLSKREKEVVRLLAADKTIAEIADTLFLSPGTVESHRKNIYTKLGIHSSAALVKYAVERGWTNGDAGI